MRYLAFDIGAESGRALVGTLESSRLVLEEVRRFPNEPVRVQAHFHWDVLRLFAEIKKGLSQVSAKYGSDLKSLAIDTWGVDFGLLDENDELLGNPYHYRDERTNGMMEEAFKLVPRQRIFEQTGIQFMQINTLFQLLALKKYRPGLLNQAKTFLQTPDLLKYFLTGEKESEFTIATTSQAFNPFHANWAYDILNKVGIPTTMFQKIRQPGSITGPLLPQVARETGVGRVHVVAVGSHDTACAVAAVPAQNDDFMYISCGTWSLVGAEVKAPVINAQTLMNDFTNEGGVGGTFRLLKNVSGLWLVQECRRTWERSGNALGYSEIAEIARSAEPLAAFIRPNHPAFLNPEDMPATIQIYCRDTSQNVPQTKGEIVRCALESLALEYRSVLEKLEGILNKRLPVIHMVGGGINNELLCQFTANATGRQVLAGPVEATATGNLLVQAMALGEIKNVAELRSVVRSSFVLRSYEPENVERWEEAYRKYLKLSE